MRPGLLIAVVAVAGIALTAARPAAAQKLVPSAGSLVPHDVNDVFLRVSNRGGYGLVLSDNDVGNFPRGSPNRYLFGAGLWVGGIGDSDSDGRPDTLTTIGFNPSNVAVIEWIEGGLGFDRDEPRFRVLDTTEPADQPIFPGDPVADQELFTIFSDRLSVFPSGAPPSIPLGIEVRQRSFAFDEEGLETAVFVQWDMTNVSDRIRASGYPIERPWTGLVLDPDLGEVSDDTAAPLVVDGQTVLLVWDVDFQAAGFQGPPGFLALVPLVDAGTPVTVSQLTSATVPGIQRVPLTDAAQYRSLAGLPPNEPTISGFGFDLRALVAWPGPAVLQPGDVHRTAVAFVWAEPGVAAPDILTALDTDRLHEDEPLLGPIVERIRAARAAHAARLAGLPALLDFPGDPPPVVPAEADRVRQNYPNPFRDQTSVDYELTAAADVVLEVIDVSGRRVARLFEGTASPGVHTVSWDGRSDSGQEAPPGVYVIRLSTGRGDSAVRALRLP